MRRSLRRVPLAGILVLIGFSATGCGDRTFKNATPSATNTLSPTFTSLNANIFQPKCVSCHGVHDFEGEKPLDGYAAVRRQVKPGVPNDSDLYEQVVSGNMPVLIPSLSDDEVLAISQWIKNGANND